MPAAGDTAEPWPKGTLATAKQGFSDMFTWKQRTQVYNDYGESHFVWQNPEKPKNPFKLFAQLSAKGWLFFIVGFFAWTGRIIIIICFFSSLTNSSRCLRLP
jgi:hypothetical protein